MTFNDFLKFDYFITKEIMPIFYIIGAVIISSLGLLIIFEGLIDPYALPGNMKSISQILTLIIGFGILIFGNVSWRVTCEFWTVLFSINEKLSIMVDAPYDLEE